jgi:hypothetical protein
LSRAVAKLASINLRKLVLSPTGSINLGFILREDLLLCSSYLPLGLPNWAVIYTPSEPGDEVADPEANMVELEQEHQDRESNPLAQISDLDDRARSYEERIHKLASTNLRFA